MGDDKETAAAFKRLSSVHDEAEAGAKSTVVAAADKEPPNIARVDSDFKSSSSLSRASILRRIGKSLRRSRSLLSREPRAKEKYAGHVIEGGLAAHAVTAPTRAAANPGRTKWRRTQWSSVDFRTLPAAFLGSSRRRFGRTPSGKSSSMSSANDAGSWRHYLGSSSATSSYREDLSQPSRDLSLSGSSNEHLSEAVAGLAPTLHNRQQPLQRHSPAPLPAPPSPLPHHHPHYHHHVSGQLGHHILELGQMAEEEHLVEEVEADVDGSGGVSGLHPEKNAKGTDGHKLPVLGPSSDTDHRGIRGDVESKGHFVGPDSRPSVTVRANALVKKEILLKVLVIGDAGVGKTSLTQRYANNAFPVDYRATIGVDFALKMIPMDDETLVRLQLWDVAGQERFTWMTRVYYRDAKGCILVFDLSNRNSFLSVAKWKRDLDNKCALADGSPIPCILVANKCDLSDRRVTLAEVEDLFHKQHFIGWTEISAKENTMVEDAMKFLLEKMLVDVRRAEAAKESQGNDANVIKLQETQRRFSCLMC